MNRDKGIKYRIEKSMKRYADIEKVFENNGCRITDLGFEYHQISKNVEGRLTMNGDYSLDDSTNFLRHQPDKLIVPRGKNKTYQAEIKYTQDNFSNFDIELASFDVCSKSAKLMPRTIMYILTTQTSLKVCWVDELLPKYIRKVHIPAWRWNVDEFQAIKNKYLDFFGRDIFKYNHDMKPSKENSGTPFVLFSKELPFIIDLNTFIRKNDIGVVEHED